MIPSLGDPVAMKDAIPLLSTYPTLDGADAVVLVRAARQYVDGLWVADGDPRLAWIKLISALEVAANRFDDTREDTAMEQLRRHRLKLHRALSGVPKDTAEEIAREVARLFKVERKVRSFVKEFGPGPPPIRPPRGAGRFAWAEMDKAIATIYNHRSRDLHDGIAFPSKLCEPPDRFFGPTPCERFVALGMSTKGGRWTAEDLPIYLHVFAHVVGGALRNWWSRLAMSA